jgi:hypothetical protein
MYPVSARFLEHINGTHHALVRARLLTTTQFGANPTGMDLPILSGDVKLSATSDNKSTLEITVPGDYWADVQPYGPEVWVARGVDYGDTTHEMVPLGYFRIDDVEQESAPYGPVRLSCSDRISQLKQNRVLYPFQVPEGYTHRKLFERLVNGRLAVGTADTPDQTVAAQYIRDRFVLGQQILEDWTWPGMPAIVGTYNDALLALYEVDGAIPAKTQAAILIDYRILCHATINDDWSWDGMPAIVNTYNETLRAENIAAGSPEPTVWLQQYATAHGGTMPVQTQAAGIIKARLESGLAINADWTWPDPPQIVTQYSKNILSQYPGAYNDRPTAITWLAGYISSHGGASQPDPITWLEIYIASHGGYDTINSLGYAAMIQGPAVPIIWSGYDPDRYFINGGPVVENSSYEFMSKLADSRGCVLRFDELGQLNIDIREPDPDSPPVYAITPGRNGNLIRASRKAGRDGVYNIVVAYGSDIAAPTGYQLAYNNDKNSRLRWDSQFGAAPRYYASPLLRTPGEAADAAATVLSRYTGLPSTVGLWTLPNPAIRPQDAISAKITGLPETHIVDVVTIPLAISGAGPVEIETKTLNDVVTPEDPTDPGGGGGGTGQPTPLQITQEKAFEITSTAENSTKNWWEQFSYLEDIGDGRGLTGGIFGATSATGDMLELVQNYTATKPGNVLASFLPGLQACATTGMGGSATSAANSNLGTPFKNAWAQAAQDPVFQTAQINYRNQVYWTPAYNQAVADGLSNLGIAIYYDTSINHGMGSPAEDDGSFDDIRAATSVTGGGSTSTLGQTANNSFSSTSSSDKTVLSKFTAGATGTLTGGHARLSLSAAGSASTCLTVYADASGVPGARLAQSSLVAVTATAETLYNYVFTGASQVTITNGTSYWIGPSWQDPGTITIAYSRNSTASQVQAVNSFAPTTFGTGTASSGPVDAYIDVNTGGTGSGPPGQGGNEAAWLNAFLDAREAVLTSWGDAPVDGRVPMFRALITSGNFALTTPFSWSVYGDSFTMSSDPLPYGWTGDGTGGGTGGGGTTTWPNPGVAHNIGSAPGQNSFNLGVGFDGTQTGSFVTYAKTHHDFARSEIEAGLTIPGFYELNAAGEVLLSSHPGGGKTSNNTSYARVEYRELERDGTTKAAWDPTKGRHYIKGRSAVDSLSAPKPEMVIAQVHDASDDTAMIYRRNATTVQAKIGNSVVATLDSGAALTEFDDWMIEIVDGTINFYWNNMSTPAHSAHFPYTTTQYFKSGAYMQWNLSNGDATIGKVRLVNLEHWHTGWPQPARPAGQTGGGTSGGSTGGTGGTTAFTAKYFVATTGSDSNSGLSKAAAKATIAGALALAGAGDTISVGAGTYTGNITINSGGSSGGGYVTIRSESPRVAVISGTGSGSQSAVQINAGYVRLQDLTITGTLGSGVRYGVDVEASNVEVKNCHIYQICKFLTEGTSFQGGAGINFDQPSYSNISIDGNEIHDIGPDPGTEQLVHGIYAGVSGSNFRIVNNLIYDCEDFGVHEFPTASSSGLQVVNNTISGCGRGILHGNGGMVRNNIVYNCLSSNYDIRGTGVTSSNNFSGGGGDSSGVSGVTNGVDVKFVSITGNDYRLQSASPCVNAGTGTGAPGTDILGVARPQGSGIDAGCYELVVSGTGGTGGPVGSTGGASNADDGVEAAKILGWGPVIDGDEFAYTGPPNSRWDMYDGPGHDGNGIRTPSAYNVSNGIMTCTGDAKGNTGGMAFNGRSSKYWRLEWRVRTYSINPQGSGHRYHAVLILWPDSDAWPQGGEDDFYECDCEDGAFTAYIHVPGNDPGNQYAFEKLRPLDLQNWHNIAFERSKSGVTCWIDGQQAFKITDPKIQVPGPLHITTQLDNFFGSSGMEPGRMDHMWVRVYNPPS